MISYDGIPLTAVSKSIGILDIQEKPPTIKAVTADRTKADGLRLLYRSKTTRVIAVEFDIFEGDPIRRREVFGDILLWADGKEKWLSLDYNANRHLVAACTKYPEYSPKSVAKSFKMEFTSYDPYWSDDRMTAVSFNTAANTNYTASMIVGGSAKSCPLCAEITNKGTTAMTSLSIAVGGKTIALAGLTLAVNRKLEIGYDDNGIMFMRIGGSSVLKRRTDASSDDLMLAQRAVNSITVLTSTKASVRLMARGLSL